MPRRKRNYSFRGKVRTNIKDSRRKGGSGYLKLPSGVSQFMPKEAGEVILDFLPYEVTDPHHLDRNDQDDVAQVGAMWWKKPFKTNRNIGADRKTVVSPATVGEKCPIAQHMRKELDDGVEYEEVKELAAKTRVLYNVIPRANSDYEEEVHVFDTSFFLFQELLDQELEVKPEKYEDFAHPDDGFALKLRFAERNLGKNKFFEVASITFMKRKNPITDEELESAVNLDEVLEILPYKTLKEMFLEEPDPDEDPDDGYDEPKKDKRRRRRAENDYVEDEPDDDPDDSDVPEEKWEKQEAEAKKQRRRRQDEPDDDPEDPDDGYDEPKKDKRRRRRAENDYVEDEPDDDPDDPDDPEDPDDEPEPKRERRRRRRG